ncbi:hypothetical protein HDU91_000407 [Kappamyces sp. JEL0680]|nr:hypothetical protein HDU91_000407 [Kappamyces sp. JEL0680]
MDALLIAGPFNVLAMLGSLYLCGEIMYHHTSERNTRNHILLLMHAINITNQVLSFVGLYFIGIDSSGRTGKLLFNWSGDLTTVLALIAWLINLYLLDSFRILIDVFRIFRITKRKLELLNRLVVVVWCVLCIPTITLDVIWLFKLFPYPHILDEVFSSFAIFFTAIAAIFDHFQSFFISRLVWKKLIASSQTSKARLYEIITMICINIIFDWTALGCYLFAYNISMDPVLNGILEGLVVFIAGMHIVLLHLIYKRILTMMAEEGERKANLWSRTNRVSIQTITATQ